jgi:hypothetical protein
MEQNIFTQRKVILYNTFNIDENATLPLIILKIYIFIFEEFFKLCSINDKKKKFKH